MASLRRALERIRSSEQSGFSLIELIVSLGIFAVFIAIYMGAVANLGRGTARAQVTAEASTGVVQVFQTFDRQVRYADTVNAAGPSTGASGARYIEFRTSEPNSSGSDVLMCTQWRFLPVEGRVEMRRWKESNLSTTTGWTTKLTHTIDKGGADYPFKMVPATAGGSNRQQLVLKLSAGNDDTGAGASMATTFVARNSSISSISNTNLANLVCNRTGLRP